MELNQENIRKIKEIILFTAVIIYVFGNMRPC